jgi:glycosyltransferase involved in cell wall biosynthesis
MAILPVSQSLGGFVKDAIFALICRIHGCKAVIHLRGSRFKSWIATQSKFWQSVVTWILRHCHGAIVLGECLRGQFSGLFPENRIFVVPNGGNFVYPIGSRTSSAFHLVCVSNLMPSKGIDDVLEALRLVIQQTKQPIKLDMVGYWRYDNYRERCESYCRTHRLPVSFHQVGQEQKKEFFASADLFVFAPRDPEGHPWVIIEAMAAGLPVVATDRGAIGEVVEHGKTGLISAPRNPEALARHILFYLNDPTSRLSAAQAAIQRYRTRYTETRMVDRLLSMMESVLNLPMDTRGIKNHMHSDKNEGIYDETAGAEPQKRRHASDRCPLSRTGGKRCVGPNPLLGDQHRYRESIGTGRTSDTDW